MMDTEMTAAAVPEMLRVRAVAGGKFKKAFAKKFGKEGSAAEEAGESKAEAASEPDENPKTGKFAAKAKK